MEGGWIIVTVLHFMLFPHFLRAAEQAKTIQDRRTETIDRIETLIREGGSINARDKEGRTALRLAVDAENLRLIKLLLERKVSLDIADNDGYTPLHIAALTGNVDIATLLLDKGADINCVCKEGRTPLFIAARENHPEMVRYLLIAGADPYKAKQGGWTPMHAAGGKSCTEVLDVFVERSIPLDVRNKENDWTLLHTAAEQNQPKACEYLLSHGIDVNIQTRCRCTPLLYAAEQGSLAAAEVLIAKGADIHARNCQGCTSLLLTVDFGHMEMAKFLLGKGADITAMNPKGRTVLNFAISKNNLKMVRFLLDKGFDINSVNGNGIPTVDFAMHRYNNGDIGLETLQQLLDWGADPNLPDLYMNLEPLYYAMQTKNEEVIALLKKYHAIHDPHQIAPFAFIPKEFIREFLVGTKSVKMTLEFNAFMDKYLADGGDLKMTDEAGNTPLHWAAEEGQKQCVEWLLAKGIDVDVRSLTKRTPLHRAALWGTGRESCGLLLEKGANIEAMDFVGNTPLHYTSQNPPITRFLVNHKANVNAQNRFGMTPLHYVCETTTSTAREAAIVLLNAGADIRLKDYRGETPLHVICRNTFEMSNVIRLMLDRGADINQPNRMGEYPLHLACQSEDVTQMLIDKGANLEVQNYYGMTPLWKAAGNGQRMIVEKLLKAGAKIDARTYARGRTPLHAAAYEGELEVVKLLLEKGADVSARDWNGCTALDIAKQERQSAVVAFLDQMMQTQSRDYDAAKADAEKQKEALQRRQDRKAMYRIDWLNDNPGPVIKAFLKSDPNTLMKLAQQKADFNERLEVLGIDEYAALHMAVYFEDEAMVRLLVKLGADINAPTMSKNSPLHIAVESDSLKMTQLLVELGADMNKGDGTGNTPFQKAVIHSSEPIIRFYISKGFSVNMKDRRGWTLLHGAAYNHGPVKLLLELGADANARNGRGETPLHLCTSLYDNSKTPQQLIAGGADVNALSNSGHTPLFYAVSYKAVQTAHFLLEKGADVNLGQLAADQSIQVREMVFANASRVVIGQPPIFAARSDLEMVNLLLEHGADYMAKDAIGQTVIHCIAGNGVPGVDDQRIIELYLEKGISINEKDNKEQTALFKAIDARRMDLVEFLLDKGADVNIKDKSGQTPLRAAYAGGGEDSLDIFKLLLNKGADKEVRSQSGEKLLWLACQHNNIEIVKLLIKHGVRTDIQVLNGIPLKKFLERSHYSEILELIQQAETTK